MEKINLEGMYPSCFNIEAPFDNARIYIFIGNINQHRAYLKRYLEEINYEGYESKTYKAYDGRPVTLKSVNDLVIIDELADDRLMYEIDAFMDQDHYTGLILITDQNELAAGTIKRLNTIFRNNSSITKNKYWYGGNIKEEVKIMRGMAPLYIRDMLIGRDIHEKIINKIK